MWKKKIALTLCLGILFGGFGLASNENLESPLKYQTIVASDVKNESDPTLDLELFLNDLFSDPRCLAKPYVLHTPPNSETASPLVSHHHNYTMNNEGVITAMRERRYTQSDQLVAEIYSLEHGPQPLSNAERKRDETLFQMIPMDQATEDALLQILGVDE